MGSGGVEQGRQELAVAENVENGVNPVLRLHGEVFFDELLQDDATLIDLFRQDELVEGEVDFVKAHDGHRGHSGLLLQLIGEFQLGRREALILVQHPDLQHDLDDVVQHFFGVLLISRLLAPHFVKLVQDLESLLVDQHLGQVLRRHLAQDLLLSLEAQVT